MSQISTAWEGIIAMGNNKKSALIIFQEFQTRKKFIVQLITYSQCSRIKMWVWPTEPSNECLFLVFEYIYFLLIIPFHINNFIYAFHWLFQKPKS